MEPQLMDSVCLITPGHVSSTPRLVKEADAFAQSGFRTHVVAGNHYGPNQALDADILSRAKWGVTLIDYSGGGRVFARKVLRRALRVIAPYAPSGWLRLAARVDHAEALRIASVASGTPADIFIGHRLAGLAAAAFAARDRGVAHGFDVEDLHDDETEVASVNPADRVAAHRLQAAILPRCAYLTASSPLIAAEVQRRYGVNPDTVLNVFPLAQATSASGSPAPISAARPGRIYWFSQTIGPGRGLERAIDVLARLRTPVELHLRGTVASDYRVHLNHLAQTASFARPIVFLPPGPPGEMVRLAATADLGLAIEESRPLNHDLCLANKIFVYLLAGIPQLLTPTTAQRKIAGELGDAALLCETAEPAAAAAQLDAFLTDSARIKAARQCAIRLATTRFCWDLEQRKCIGALQRALKSARKGRRVTN